MTDFKTIMYSMSSSISGDFEFPTAKNTFDSFQLNNGANWSNQTSGLTPTTTASVNLNNIGGINYGAVGAIWYFGKSTKFDLLALQFAAVTDTSATRLMTYQYWNGSIWVTLAQAGVTQGISLLGGALGFSNASQYLFKLNPVIYNNWSTTTVNGSSSLYFVRIIVGTAALTTANLQTVCCYDFISSNGVGLFSRVFTTTDASELAFTNATSGARAGQNAAFTFTANTTNAKLYLGSTTPNIMGFSFLLSTAGTVGTGVWEYWNGSTWASIPYDISATIQTATAVNETLKSTGATWILFDGGELSNFTQTTKNGENLYWIRFRVTSNFTVSPVFNYIAPFNQTTIDRTVWIPESTNRTIQSAFVKLSCTNSEVNSPQRIAAYGRFGSDSYVPLSIGDAYASQTSFLDIGGKIFTTTANDGIFTDATADASDSGASDVSVSNTQESNIYFCYPNEVKWTKDELYIAISLGGVFAGGLVEWEYWNGSAWTSFDPIPILMDKDLNSTPSGTRFLTIPILNNWTATTVNSFTGYIFRRRITQVYSSVSTYSTINTSLPGFNTSTYVNSGENQTFTFYVDCTQLFKDSFSGTSQTLSLKLGYTKYNVFVSNNMNLSGELFITYGADEQTTRIKSVMIPINITDNLNLTNTLQTIGSNEIPTLDTYLPEASKTIRNFYIVFTGNDQNNICLTTEYRIKVGGSNERYSYGMSPGGFTGTTPRLIYVDDSISTNFPQQIQLALSSRLATFKNWAMHAVVTYEYNSATTTRAINSLVIPFETSSIILPQNAPQFSEKVRSQFFIEEPGTINNVRIGAHIYFGDVNTPSINIKEKSESTYKKITYSTPAMTCAGFRYGYTLPITTLSRGLNEIGVDLYGDMANIAVSLPSCYYTCGFFIVNYHSDVYSGGINKHNKTISCIHQIQKSNSWFNRSFNKLSNPFSEWYINTFGIIGEFFVGTTSNLSVTSDTRYIFENTSIKEVFGAGGFNNEVSEHIHFDMITNDRDKVKKYPGDLHDHRVVDLFDTNSRFITEYGLYTIIGGSQSFATCHEIAYPISGSVIGYSGNGAGLSVKFYDMDSAQLLFALTTAIGGTFSGVWYDNTLKIVCDVYDPSLNKYVESSPQYADAGSITLNFNAGVTPTKKSFVWGS
jgi:hypothetical protein